MPKRTEAQSVREQFPQENPGNNMVHNFFLLTFQFLNNVLDQLQSLVADTDVLEISQTAFQKTVQNQCQGRVRQHSLRSRQV